MLTPLSTTEENNGRTSTGYYYPPPPPPHSHYYCSVPFNNDSNNFHHYYTSPPIHSHSNEENSNNLVSTSVYTPTYHQQPHYSSEGPTNDMFYSQIPLDQPIIPVYDYNLSPVPTPSSNPIFHQTSNYLQSSVEQTHNSNTGYLTSYVSLKLRNVAREIGISSILASFYF
jgi:hypothetical protein